MPNNENRTGRTYVPVETVERYEFTTDDVRDYLQNILNSVTSKLRAVGEDVEDVQITLVSLNTHSKIAPFVLILPEEVLAGKNQDSGKSSNNGRRPLGVFTENGDEDRRGLQFKKCYFAAIGKYMYTKEDRKSMLNGSKYPKEETGLNGKDRADMIRCCVARPIRVNGNRLVVVLLDPIRLFSDMVRAQKDIEYEKSRKESAKANGREYNERDARRYTVSVSANRISSTSFKYFVSKEPRKSGKRKGNNSDLTKAVMTALMKSN